ncbi:MAG: MlaD family protein [Myxococcota bacterium]
MSDEPTGSPVRDDGGVPSVIVHQRARLSIVWFLPVLAAVVGLYLAYTAWKEKGPTITITFESAEGLEAGQTKLKYKQVEVGLVEAVQLTDDLSQVEVTASMSSEFSRHLTTNTKFWVVRAQVSAGEISGLDTVLSGVYIAVDPSREGERSRLFVGLEKAPVVTSDKPGTLFDLRAQDLGSLQIGAPVYYRWLRVGQVAGYELAELDEHVSVQVFIEAPHDRRVRSTTRFWNASGIDVALTAKGIQIDSPSLISMLVGGVAFETPATVTVAEDVPENMIFELYPNKKTMRRPRYLQKTRFLLYFDESVAGLESGSSVEFRGIKLGEVLDVELTFDVETNSIRTPVVIEIEPERFGLDVGREDGVGLDRLAEMVADGFRAELTTNSLLTGQKTVNFDFFEFEKPAEIRIGEIYPILPTASSGFGQIADRVSRIVEKLDQVPIESIGTSLEEALAGFSEMLVEVKQLAGAANRDVLPSLSSSLEKLEKTLSSAEALIAPESAVAQDLERLVSDLSDAARSIRMLAERLEEHPEELLRGKRE